MPQGVARLCAIENKGKMRLVRAHRKGKEVKNFSTIPPRVGVAVLPLALIIESVYLGHKVLFASKAGQKTPFGYEALCCRAASLL